MSKKLPVGEFEWVNPEDYTEDIIKIMMKIMITVQTRSRRRLSEASS